MNNTCVIGSLDCTSGVPVCKMTGNTDAGTACGTSQICDGNGTCEACDAGASCGPPDDCHNAGQISCTGGKSCVPTQPKLAGTFCGDAGTEVCSGTGQCVTCGTSGAPRFYAICEAGVCIDTQYDPANCGACGNDCSDAGGVCSKGVCVACAIPLKCGAATCGCDPNATCCKVGGRLTCC
jgi:hypothetical protein